MFNYDVCVPIKTLESYVRIVTCWLIRTRTVRKVLCIWSGGDRSWIRILSGCVNILIYNQSYLIIPSAIASSFWCSFCLQSQAFVLVFTALLICLNVFLLGFSKLSSGLCVPSGCPGPFFYLSNILNHSMLPTSKASGTMKKDTQDHWLRCRDTVKHTHTCTHRFCSLLWIVLSD